MNIQTLVQEGLIFIFNKKNVISFCTQQTAMDSSGLSTKASTETHVESTTAPSISNDPMYVVTPQNDSKITTSEVNQMTTINATTLVEILNSVVAAANIETQSNEGRMSSQSLQFQLQLTPQTTPVDATENGVSEAKGKGRQSGTKGKGKEKQPWHYHLGKRTNLSC